MNATDMLALGEALARTTDVLHPGEQLPFRDYVGRVLDAGERRILALLGDTSFVVSVDGHPLASFDSAIPVTSVSRVVLYRRQGPALDVLTRGVVRRICLN